MAEAMRRHPANLICEEQGSRHAGRVQISFQFTIVKDRLSIILCKGTIRLRNLCSQC